MHDGVNPFMNQEGIKFDNGLIITVKVRSTSDCLSVKKNDPFLAHEGMNISWPYLWKCKHSKGNPLLCNSFCTHNYRYLPPLRNPIAYP